jgi:hypothetical protein
MRSNLVASIMVAILSACDVTAPQLDSVIRDVLIVDSQESYLSVIGSVEPRQNVRIGMLPQRKGPYALAPDRATLYLVAFDSYTDRELIALDMRALAITRRLPLAQLEEKSHLQNLSLRGDQAIAVSADGTRLVIHGARNGIRGLAILDARTGIPLEWIDSLSVSPHGIVTLPATPSSPSGAFAIVATRTHAESNTGYLFIVDALTFTVRDSASLGPTTSAPSGGLGQAVASPDGRRVYVSTSDRLLAYDIVGQQITASTPLPSRGHLTISPSGTTLYLTDPGDGRNYPGSGLIYVFGPLLEPRTPIVLPRVKDDIEETTTWAAVGRDDRTLYVSAGVPRVGPLFPGASARLLVIDLETRRITASIPLSKEGPGPVFVR